jgi:hypothetical protein
MIESAESVDDESCACLIACDNAWKSGGGSQAVDGRIGGVKDFAVGDGLVFVCRKLSFFLVDMALIDILDGLSAMREGLSAVLAGLYPIKCVFEGSLELSNHEFLSNRTGLLYPVRFELGKSEGESI